MKVKIFFCLAVCFNFIISNQIIDLPPNSTICTVEGECVPASTVYVQSETDKCTEELLINYGDGKQAYLSQDGKISKSYTEIECSSSYKRVKYALKSLVFEVIKHKKSAFVNDINHKKNEESKTESIFAQFVQYAKDKRDDLIQYICIGLYLIRITIKMKFKKAFRKLFKR